MNFIKRIAEMAQSRLLGSGGSDGRPIEMDSGFDNVTPSSSAFPVNAGNIVNAPQRRAIGGTRYVSRVVPLRMNVDESRLEDSSAAEPNETPPSLVVEPPQQQRIHHRHPFQIQIARNLIDLARGYPNTRAYHRRTIQTKLCISRALSASCPQNYPNSFIDEWLRPHEFEIVMSKAPSPQEVMELYSWNPSDRSLNIFVKPQDKLTFHRQPVPQSTDCIRGKVGFSKGFHVWQLIWPTEQRGTHPIVGVATKNAVLHAAGYGSLLGTNPDGYGWDLRANKCYHDSKKSKGWHYPSKEILSSETFIVPENFYCILNMDEGYLAFATSTQYLGIAFRGLKGKTLYPMVSAVWGHCEVTIRYMGSVNATPRPLADVCRRKVRCVMGKSRLHRADELQMPIPLYKYVIGKAYHH